MPTFTTDYDFIMRLGKFQLHAKFVAASLRNAQILKGNLQIWGAPLA